MSPKLPKELQKQKKQKMAKAKGSSASASSGGSSRAMRRQMQKQGIQDMEQIEATEVIIRCADKEYVISEPQVIKLKQQGMTVHQIIGNSTERELGEVSEQAYVDGDYADDDSSEVVDVDLEESTGSVTVQEQDVMLVAAQANVSEEIARAALEEAEGDLARAILNLKTRG